MRKRRKGLKLPGKNGRKKVKARKRNNKIGKGR